MKWIVAGSRTFDDYKLLSDELDKVNNLFGISEIVSGTARGADSLGERYARAHNIPVKRFPAQWDTYGKSAGYRRNMEMAMYADACICFQVNNSRGTEHMINIASSKGLQLITIRLQL